jgi:chemotaxis protein histidine kinase CheA
MAKSVQELPLEIQECIEVHEWDMRTLEGNSRFLALKGKCLPSIALDEQLVYESFIPSQEELVSVITRLWQQKNN